MSAVFFVVAAALVALCAWLHRTYRLEVAVTYRCRLCRVDSPTGAGPDREVAARDAWRRAAWRGWVAEPDGNCLCPACEGRPR